MSIAGIALANGLNANLLRRWVIEGEHTGTKLVAQVKSGALETSAPTQAVASFVPVRLEPSPSAPDIRIEIKRNGSVVTVTWPTSAAAECGAWLREVLR